MKVSRVAFSLCPKFQLHVRSPVETIFHSVVTSRQGSTGTALACIAAYLLHTHEKDLTTIAHNDTTVCRALKSQPSFISEWNLSSLIFGMHTACIYITFTTFSVRIHVSVYSDFHHIRKLYTELIMHIHREIWVQ